MQEFEFLVSSKFNNIKAIDFLKLQGVSDEIIKCIKENKRRFFIEKPRRRIFAFSNGYRYLCRDVRRHKFQKSVHP